MTQELALFDLDNTLLDGDSDYLWAQYLIDRGILDRDRYEARNLHFYEQYKAGTLDIFEFLEFQLAPLASQDRVTLDAWHREFMARHILPIVAPGTRALIEAHRQQGRTLAIVTATNAFVTRPIATLLGIDHLIATDLEERDGRYTGRPAGTPSFREGKVVRLDEWLAARGTPLAGFRSVWFYSDSANDLPLLERVTHPVAVDADPRLTEVAITRGWPRISLRTA